MTRPVLYGVAELAELAGVTRQTIHQWVEAGHLPPPDYELSCGHLWRRETLVRSKAALNRPRREQRAG